MSLFTFLFNIDRFAGAVVLFVATSAYLTYHVESEQRAKRALEVIPMLMVFGVVIYGYAVTGSFILEPPRCS